MDNSDTQLSALFSVALETLKHCQHPSVLMGVKGRLEGGGRGWYEGELICGRYQLFRETGQSW